MKFVKAHYLSNFNFIAACIGPFVLLRCLPPSAAILHRKIYEKFLVLALEVVKHTILFLFFFVCFCSLMLSLSIFIWTFYSTTKYIGRPLSFFWSISQSIHGRMNFPLLLSYFILFIQYFIHIY